MFMTRCEVKQLNNAYMNAVNDVGMTDNGLNILWLFSQPWEKKEGSKREAFWSINAGYTE